MKRIIGIIMLIALVLSGCSKSDDENKNVAPANAKGIWIDWDEKEYEMYFWINEYVVQIFNEEESTDLNQWRFQNIPYYKFTMDKLYEVMSEDAGIEINESNIRNHYPKSADYYKRKTSTYKYFTMVRGEVYLFNRISNINYNN
jgi:hypothetical protein